MEYPQTWTYSNTDIDIVMDQKIGPKEAGTVSYQKLKSGGGVQSNIEVYLRPPATNIKFLFGREHRWAAN